MTNYERGAERERQVVKLLENAGAVAFRTAGSRSAADVIALAAGRPPLFVQVKCGKQPYKGFSRGERIKLKQMAERGGGVAVLCHWAPRKDPEWIPPEEWPDSEAA